MAVTQQLGGVVFQGLDIMASMMHDEGQLCAGEHITASKSGLIMVRW